MDARMYVYMVEIDI